MLIQLQGEPIETANKVCVIPVSKVNFGFAAGGTEFNGKVEKNNIIKNEKDENKNVRMPFGGGSGAGVSISPIAFIIIQETGVKLLPIEHTSSLDKLLDLVPDLFDRTNSIIQKQINKVEKMNENFVYHYNEKNDKNDIENNNSNSSSKNAGYISNDIKKYDIEYDETGDM